MTRPALILILTFVRYRRRADEDCPIPTTDQLCCQVEWRKTCSKETGLLIQFFFAGLSIFVGPTWWDTHTAFGRGFGVTAVLLVLFAILGRLPRRQIVMASILIPLYVLQILLIELPGRFGVIAVSALHPVNAGIMLGLAIVLAHRAWKITREDKSNYREP